MSALLDALGFVGETLGRPGAAVRGLLAGRPEQVLNLLPGSETLGLLEPGSQVSGRDLLEHLGVMDKDESWGNWGAGLATELLTDPLTLLPAARLAGGALRGAAPAAEAAAAAGAAREAPAMFASSADRLTRMAAAERAARGLPPASLVAAEAAATAPAAAAGERSALSSLLGGRRQFDVIEIDPVGKKIISGRTGPGPYGRMMSRGGEAPVGFVNPVEDVFGAARAFTRAAGEAALEGREIGGGYFPRFRTAVLPASPGPRVLAEMTPDMLRRHEVIHGLIDAAVRTGDTGGLPWIGRAAARLRGPGEWGDLSGPRQALAYLSDETAARALQHRGAWEQLKGGARWLFRHDPAREVYLQTAAGMSPGVARTFRALPYAADSALVAGLAGTGAGLGAYTYAQDEAP